MKKRILIVDDNRTLANVYRANLAAGGSPSRSRTTDAALAAARAAAPDLLLPDLMLPGRSGIEVLVAMRADEGLRSVPVVVMSNAYTPDRLEEVRDAGATRVIVKASSTPKQVLEVVRGELENA